MALESEHGARMSGGGGGHIGGERLLNNIAKNPLIINMEEIEAAGIKYSIFHSVNVVRINFSSVNITILGYPPFFR